MGLVDYISSYINYGTTKAAQYVHTIARNPSAAKKVFQVINKSFAVRDLTINGEILERGLTEAFKSTVEVIEFYGSFKNMMFWINPFSKATMDETLLWESLKTSLTISQDKKNKLTEEQLAKRIFEEVMNQEEYYGKGEVRQVIRASLEREGYGPKSAQQLVSQVLIQQKSRPLSLLLPTACFTIADLGSNLLTLQEWKVLSLETAAARIGDQIKVFPVGTQIKAKTFLGSVSSIGLILSLGSSLYQWRNLQKKSVLIKDKKMQKQIDKEKRETKLDIIAAGVDLAATATPLLFTIHPLAAVSLAIVAKGTGLICILSR